MSGKDVGLVSLFNGISTFVGYLIPKPSLSESECKCRTRIKIKYSKIRVWSPKRSLAKCHSLK